MKEELHKRIEEAAREYQEEYETTEKVAFTHGAIWGYKEAIKIAKEWLKEYYHLFDHFDKGEVIDDFEANMNKLWEESK